MKGVFAVIGVVGVVAAVVLDRVGVGGPLFYVAVGLALGGNATYALMRIADRGVDGLDDNPLWTNREQLREQFRRERRPRR